MITSAMESSQSVAALKALALEHVIPHFANNTMLQTTGPRIFDRGEGCYLFDITGKPYLDTFASLLTTICGHHRPEVAAAITAQMNRLEFFPNYEDAYTVPLIELAAKLADITPGDLSSSFFVNSGSEANETAIKIARQYHLHNGEPGRHKVIARQGSYHGTTLGGVSMTGLGWFREYFDPLIPGCLFAPSARCGDGGAALEAMQSLIEREGPHTVSAVIMDPVPGSNTGYPLPSDDYLPGVRELCDRHGIVLIFDEVQTGFGKTGKWFACEHWNVVPDILTIGKGFSGGYVPLGAAVVRKTIADSFRAPGRELRSGSTYGGHTIACAATLANIAIIENEGLVNRARDLGQYTATAMKRLYRHRIVADCRGIGLLRAVEIMADPAKRTPLSASQNVGLYIRDWCYERGIILRANGSILVIAPALIITREQIDFIVNSLDEAIGDAISHFGL